MISNTNNGNNYIQYQNFSNNKRNFISKLLETYYSIKIVCRKDDDAEDKIVGV